MRNTAREKIKKVQREEAQELLCANLIKGHSAPLIARLQWHVTWPQACGLQLSIRASPNSQEIWSFNLRYQVSASFLFVWAFDVSQLFLLLCFFYFFACLILRSTPTNWMPGRGYAMNWKLSNLPKVIYELTIFNLNSPYSKIWTSKGINQNK